MLDLADRLVVIVGGGTVATRKAIGLFAAGAKRIRVVSPIFHVEMPGGVERVAEKYESRYLHGADLVFAATDRPEVNSLIVADARARKILVNRVDSDEGDFTTPAIFREDSVTIAVSAGGSPAIAAKIRDGLQQSLDRRWLALAKAMKELRPLILSANLPEHARRELFKSLATEEAAELAGDVVALEALIESRIGKKLRQTSPA